MSYTFEWHFTVYGLLFYPEKRNNNNNKFFVGAQCKNLIVLLFMLFRFEFDTDWAMLRTVHLISILSYSTNLNRFFNPHRLV